MSQDNNKQVRQPIKIQSAKKIAKGVKLMWKLVGGEIHFLKSEDEAIHHKVPLSKSEIDHLNGGGTVIVAHACGQDLHLKF
jgi:hypothetical protein